MALKEVWISVWKRPQELNVPKFRFGDNIPLVIKFCSFVSYLRAFWMHLPSIGEQAEPGRWRKLWEYDSGNSASAVHARAVIRVAAQWLFESSLSPWKLNPLWYEWAHHNYYYKLRCCRDRQEPYWTGVWVHLALSQIASDPCSVEELWNLHCL